jgi:hypothetical protein
LVFLPRELADARLFPRQMVRLGSRWAVQVILPVRGDTVEETSAHVPEQAPALVGRLDATLGEEVPPQMLADTPWRAWLVALRDTRRSVWMSMRGSDAPCSGSRISNKSCGG